APGQLACDERTGGIVAALADEAGVGAERGRPGGDVRGLSAGTGAGSRGCVGAPLERSLQAHDHVEQQVAERAEGECSHRTIVPWTATGSATACVPSSSEASWAPPRCSR